MTTESKNESIIKPLERPVNAASHNAVYKMHRYYARRPWNVFEHIIKHYTKEDDLILDPFCGGGVTVVESLKLKRKVIGVDLNPLATFITRMEVEPLDVTEFKIVFNKIIRILEKDISPLYKTTCNKCENEAIANWFEWSNVFKCPSCKKNIIISNVKKISNGTYKCGNCNVNFKPSEAVKIQSEIIRKNVTCKKCNIEREQDVTEEDKKYCREIEKNFDKLIKKEKLWYPKDEFPDGDRERDDALYQKGITHFYKLFTKRNLLANSILLKTINDFETNKNIKDFLYFAFSSNLSWTSIMSSDTGHGWQHHAYWIPNIFFELNVLKSLQKRTLDGNSTLYNGKIFSNNMIGDYCLFADNFNDFQKDSNCWIINKSSDQIPIPDSSVDAVITDPPFGGNVQYAELSDFWLVWLQNYLNINGVIDNSLEAIQTRHSGFETEKDEKHYEDMLYRIFKECHRVLKKDGYLVLTFHNKDINVWMSLHRAANRAGFKLPTENESKNRGIIYQSPIQNYTQTLHTKAKGSMLGDFILSFKRLDMITDVNKIKSALSKEQEIKLVEKISELIEFHGGADDNTIMTTLIPTLNELGIFRQVESFNWIDFLNKHFEKDKKTNKWYRNTDFEEDTKTLRPIDFIKAEELTKNLIVNYLKEKRIATVDDLLTEIYTKLVNSHRPGMEAINTVLNKYCVEVKSQKSKKLGYRLRTEKETIDNIMTKKVDYQIGIFGSEILADGIGHNEIIKFLSNFAFELGKKVHVGETEQRKEKEFKNISKEMTFKEDFGISSEIGFRKIKEIDLLILEGKEITAAFEVTTSINTAREAINDRYRDLYSLLPNTNIRTFVVVKDEDYKKAFDMINSDANKQSGLSKKVKIIKRSNLIKSNFAKWLKN